MQKAYNIKLFDITGTFEVVLPPNILMSGISFSETINGGQGALRLKLNLPLASDLVGYNNLIKVYESDDNHTARLIYTGIIGNIMRVNENSSEYIEVNCIGLASIMSFFYYQNSGYTFNYSGNGTDGMKAVVDYFSTIYPGLISYTWTSVETAPSSVNLSFDYTKCLDALKNVSGVFPTWWWSIDEGGVLQFHPIVSGATEVLHKFQVWVNVDRISIQENSERIVNKYILKYSSGTYISTDSSSVSDNGLRELYADESSKINDLTTATAQGNAFVVWNKDAKRKITVEVNSNYDIESIRVGHFVSVQNLEYEIVSLQVKKLEYNMDKIKLELEDFYSFGNEVFS